VQRVRRQAGLQVKERQRRTRRVGPTLAKRLRAQQANQVWSWDLLYDQTEHGRSLRILSLIDEYTKECLALQVGYSLRAIDAIKALEAAIARMEVRNISAATTGRSLSLKPSKIGPRSSALVAFTSPPVHAGNKPISKASTTS
jgi:hypothetical protein